MNELLVIITEQISKRQFAKVYLHKNLYLCIYI